MIDLETYRCRIGSFSQSNRSRKYVFRGEFYKSSKRILMEIRTKTRILLGLFLLLGSLTTNLGKAEQVNLVHHGKLHVQPCPGKIGGYGVWNMQSSEYIFMVRRGKKRYL